MTTSSAIECSICFEQSHLFHTWHSKISRETKDHTSCIKCVAHMAFLKINEPRQELFTLKCPECRKINFLHVNEGLDRRTLKLALLVNLVFLVSQLGLVTLSAKISALTTTGHLSHLLFWAFVLIGIHQGSLSQFQMMLGALESLKNASPLSFAIDCQVIGLFIILMGLLEKISDQFIDTAVAANHRRKTYRALTWQIIFYLLQSYASHLNYMESFSSQIILDQKKMCPIQPLNISSFLKPLPLFSLVSCCPTLLIACYSYFNSHKAIKNVEDMEEALKKGHLSLSVMQEITAEHTEEIQDAFADGLQEEILPFLP